MLGMDGKITGSAQHKKLLITASPKMHPALASLDGTMNVNVLDEEVCRAGLAWLVGR